MKIIVFQLIRGIYFGDELRNDNSWILSGFLRDDVGTGENPYKDFINNPVKNTCSSNSSWLEKDGDNIMIGYLWAEDPYEDYITMTQKEFLFLVDQWCAFRKQKPQEIIVYKEGESYRLEGHGFPDKKE